MRKTLIGYVVNFNRRHRRYDHLFQNRYKSIVCQEDVYLKELVRYIYLNLLRAGLVRDLKELNRNPWSGYSALAGKPRVLKKTNRDKQLCNKLQGFIKFKKGDRPKCHG